VACENLPVFVRLKEVAGRRYVYLVDGKRRGGRVRQKVLRYLGALPSLASGIPEDVKRRAEEGTSSKVFDWNEITEQVKRIPLRFEELSEMRMRQYALAVKARSLKITFPEVKADPSITFKQRSDGELSALSKLAAKRFQQEFEELGEGRYRLRL